MEEVLDAPLPQLPARARRRRARGQAVLVPAEPAADRRRQGPAQRRGARARGARPRRHLRCRASPSGSRRCTCRGRSEPVRIPRDSEALYLLQQVRDEAHRFAITYHRQLRGKKMTRLGARRHSRPRPDPQDSGSCKEFGVGEEAAGARRGGACSRCRGCPTRSGRPCTAAAQARRARTPHPTGRARRMDEDHDNDAPLDVTIITGMSGAGRSEAAHVLEDLGYFVIDNLPPMLIGKVAELARGHEKPVALRARRRRAVAATSCTTCRPRSTSCTSTGVTTRILFLDAADDVLVRRYEASRRRHPLSDSERVSDGIARERALLEPLEGRGRPHRRHVDPQRARAARPAARAVRASTTTRRRAAGQRRVVRVQARAAARRRPRVRLPLPARTRTGSTSCGR